MQNHDSLDRLTRERHTDYYGQVMSDEQYEYDLAGNRTGKTVLDGNGDPLVTVDYSFPAANKLGSWTVAETNLAARFSVVGSSADPIGVGIRYGKLWVSNSPAACVTPYVDSSTNFYAFGLTCGMGTQYVYAAIRDVAGNTIYVTNRFYPTCLTNGSYQYNAAGCLTNRQYVGQDYVENLALTWDSQYQLIGVSTNGVLAESYGYDGAGRRIFTVEGGTTNWMVYDGNQVVAEVDNSGNLKKSYVYEGLDRAVSMTTYGTVTNTYYFIRDHLGSTLALVDAGGNIVESYRYDAWGRVLGVYNAAGSQIDESAIGNRILWQGREYSWATGLYCFRARWYEPVTGRWLSNDPIGISGGLNQYVFCANNPVNFVDPLGLWGVQFGDVNLGMGNPWLAFDNSSWMDISRGAAATLDGIIPFADPFESAYADECGNVNSTYRTSRTLGSFSRDIYLGSRIPNLGQWARNPLLYEIGQTTLSPTTFNAVRGLSAIERGRYLVNAANGNYLRAAFSTAWGEVGSTIGTGLTPGGWLLGLGAFEAADAQTRK